MTDRYSSESPLSATWRPAVRERAVLAGLVNGADEESLQELAALARAAGAEPVGQVLQARSKPDPATFVGKGKVHEIHELVHATGADAVILDDELSAGQLRNLEERLRVKVLDRTALILDIFALHARSGEGKAQVELAQLNYLLPRLRGWGEAMSRLGGGIGTRGPGETKLEVDRQHIRRRIAKLRRDITDLGRTRRVKRAGRERDGLFLAALVGYTNAGKSTLMNALSGADVLVADQPFATLDPTTRRTTLPNGTVVLLSDTVGFVNKLPPTLVAAFRATLEELEDADLLVQVVDVSHPNLHERMAVVAATLRDLGLADRPSLIVLNKADALRGPEGDAMREALSSEFPTAVFTSASTGVGVDELRDRLAAEAMRGWRRVTVRLPYSAGGLVQRIREHGNLRSADYGEAGIDVDAEVPPAFAAELERTGSEASSRR